MKFLSQGQRIPMRWVCWSQSLFFIIGILALTYCVFVLLDTTLFQAFQARRFQQALEGSGSPAGSDEKSKTSPLLSAPGNANRAGGQMGGFAGEGSTLGQIEISRLGLTAMILEGTDKRTLRRAVGHIAGTPLPGRQGNVGIAGHRDTFFRTLRDIRIDDEIRLTTWDGSYRYRVAFTRVVAPEDTDVLAGSDDALLTLVTCYPFYFVGPAPGRFIVRAYRVTG